MDAKPVNEFTHGTISNMKCGGNLLDRGFKYELVNGKLWDKPINDAINAACHQYAEHNAGNPRQTTITIHSNPVST